MAAAAAAAAAAAVKGYHDIKYARFLPVSIYCGFCCRFGYELGDRRTHRLLAQPEKRNANDTSCW